MSVTNKKYSVQNTYMWTEDSVLDPDEYADTLEEAVELAKKQLKDENRSVVFVVQRVAVVRDKNKAVEPDIEVEYVEEQTNE